MTTMTDDQADQGFACALTDRTPSMPSSGAHTSASSRAFDPALASRRAKVQAEVDVAMDAAMRQIVARFSEKLDPGLRISREGKVNIRSPEGKSRMYDAVIERILSGLGATQTQTMIRQDVQSRFPDVSVPKDWTKPLPVWRIQELKSGIRGGRYGTVFTRLKVNQGMSLSSLHNAAKAHVQRMQDGCISFNATVTISRDRITIDGLTAKISPTKSGGKTYRYARFNADELATHFRA